MENLLKKFKDIQPDSEFKERSRALILISPQTSFHPPIFRAILNTLQYGTAFGLTTVLIFLILGGLSILNQKIFAPAILSNLDPESINKEVETLNIQLSQVNYYEDSLKKVEVALKDLSSGNKDPENQKEIDRLFNELAL